MYFFLQKNLKVYWCYPKNFSAFFIIYIDRKNMMNNISTFDLAIKV